MKHNFIDYAWIKKVVHASFPFEERLSTSPVNPTSIKKIGLLLTIATIQTENRGNWNYSVLLANVRTNASIVGWNAKRR